MNKVKVGIFFGGSSREREISFAGGRTVYDNLNKSLFEAIPIFVDSNNKMVILNWENIYKGTIRDFYPAANLLSKKESRFQVYIESLHLTSDEEYSKHLNEIGTEIALEKLSKTIDFAFLSLHGCSGEDGQIQGLLEFLKIPYTGSGIYASSLGIDKGIQKDWMKIAGFDAPESFIISKNEWKKNKEQYFQKAVNEVGFPLVIRPAHQGSSIGVSILNKADKSTFNQAINKSFFIEHISANDWNSLDHINKVNYIQELSDIRNGLGYPLMIEDEIIYHPEDLISSLDQRSKAQKDSILKALQTENKVLVEAFIDGREFSTIVLRKEDNSLSALPPTEILKGGEVYDYRSKYLPGLSRKLTPIDLPNSDIERIQQESIKLMELFQFDTYARIDGFIKKDGTIYLNDPNTTSGMLPSSFFFHQAAELGLNPSQFLTYIIRISLTERINSGVYGYKTQLLIDQLDKLINSQDSNATKRKKIGVIFGGYSSERHISVESGRNIYEKLASSEKYDPIPLFLLGDENNFALYQIPINLVLKDNADDIRDKILNFKIHPLILDLKTTNKDILEKYGDATMVTAPQKVDLTSLCNMVDGVFIALHGRPGEDGNLQAKLDALNIPYNGSPPESASTTIDKYTTLQKLKANGFEVTDQMLVNLNDYQHSPSEVIQDILSKFEFPFILKPVDDGCSSAVQIIKSKLQLENYLIGIFRTDDSENQWRENLGLKLNEEFPFKKQVLVEKLITANGAKQFMEITGGLLTHLKDGEISYEIFEPSEALATGEILSLEEKFLAGEGQNITPARFGWDKSSYEKIASQVKRDFEKAAKILNVQGYARIDAFVRIFDEDTVETIIIEINSLPGMTPATCIFHQAAINNYKPLDFIDGILNFALDNKSCKSLV